MSLNNNIHFPNLTEFRGLAALAVLISHIDQSYYLFGFESLGISNWGIGGDAVTAFFVLSGFLITYLLVEEKTKTGTIQIKKFYIKRILRIWPVYYISLVLTLFLIGGNIIKTPENLELSILLYFFLAANVAYVLGLAIQGIAPLWSVGVEEQFYAIWPWIVKKFSNTFLILILITAIYIVAKLSLWYLDKDGGLIALMHRTRIDCMAIGGILSMCYFQKKYLKSLYHPISQIIAYILIIAIYLFHISLIAELETEIFAFCFGVIILNLATNPKSLIQLKIPGLQFLGKISYGLYCYHMATILALSYMINTFNLQYLTDSFLTASMSILVFAIIVSYISFRYVETPILALKSKFQYQTKEEVSDSNS